MAATDAERTCPGDARGEVRPAGERVMQHLREAMAQARYAPGQRLVEADLTAELGVSRGTVREAFRRLAAEGLIEIVPNRGALVRRLSFREVGELFQIRMELEALAARLVAGRIDAPGVRERFEADTAEVWSDIARVSYSDYTEENKRFHDALFAAAGNCQLLAVNRSLQLPLLMFRASTPLSTSVLDESVKDHRRIVEAILAGDVAGANRTMRLHLLRAAAAIDGMPREIFRPDVLRLPEND